MDPGTLVRARRARKFRARGLRLAPGGAVAIVIFRSKAAKLEA